MLYICHFFCLRVYALHFRGKEKHIPKLDVMTFHSHPPIRISRLSSEAGWCPSGRVFGGSVEASWHHLQSFATTLGWGALGGGHNSWSPKKRDGQGVLKLLKGLNCHYNEWWFVGSSWKVWVLLGFWGCRLVRSLGWSSHSSTFHVSNSRFPKVSEGFRRFPKDSEPRAAHIPNGGFHFFFPPWGADASGHTDVAELRLTQRHHFFGECEYLGGGSSILGQSLDQNGPFFMGWFYESSVAGQRMNQMHLIHWFQMPCNPCLRAARGKAADTALF